jgi:hypothetical protein
VTAAVCSIPECSKPTHGRGWCGTHYAHWRRYGHPLRRPTYSRGTASKSTLVNGLPCREYQGKLNEAGYARLHLGPAGEPVMLHRWVVEQAEGVPLKPWPEEVVMHLCDNPPCFLYDHLRRATQLDNVHDMAEKGRKVQVQGVASPHAKLTDDQVAAVRGLRGAGATYRAIADRFGVSRTLVRRIATGQHRATAGRR